MKNSENTKRAVLPVILSTMLFAGIAAADTFVWTGAVSGSMNDPDNYTDDAGQAVFALPGETDTIVFSVASGEVANMPDSNSSSARYGFLNFTTDGYVITGTDLYAKRFILEDGITVTNHARLCRSGVNDLHLQLKDNAKFVMFNDFGSWVGGSGTWDGNDLYIESWNNAEVVFAGGGKSTKFRNSWNNYIITFQGGRNHSMYLQLTGGTPRIRTDGEPITYTGPSQISWQTGNMRVGGAGSGNIYQTSLFEPNWGGGKTLHVEEIIYTLDRIATDHNRNSAGTEDFTKSGNGTLVINGNGGFNQSGANDKNGLLFVLANGTTCFNGDFFNFSRANAVVGGLRVNAGARMEGVGMYDTRFNANNKSAEIHGTIAPGCSHMEDSKHVGTLTYIGTNFTFKAGSCLEIKAGHDKHAKLVLDASPVTIESNVTLSVIPLTTPTAPAPFTILENTGGGVIAGTFKDMPESALFQAESNGIVKKFRITYLGAPAMTSS